MVVEALRDACKSGMHEIQYFEVAKKMFTMGSDVKGEFEKVRRNFMFTAFSDSARATIVSFKDERIKSTIDHFSLKLKFIEYAWERQF